MNNVISVNFKNRSWSHVLAEPVQAPVLESESLSGFEIMDANAKMVEYLLARYEGNLPRGGVITQRKLTTPLDSYSRGCTSNSIHLDSGALRKAGLWNRPMPFPVCLLLINKFLVRNAGKKNVRLGHVNDPFAWLDQKYGHTKRVLALAKKNDVSFNIRTFSDLCAHDDYIDLIKDGGHTVTFNMGFKEFDGNEHVVRLTDPGAPSLLRRQKAIDKLRAAGVKVRTVMPSIHDLDADRMREFLKRMGWGSIAAGIEHYGTETAKRGAK